jgi:PAS domain S-box-containing protein
MGSLKDSTLTESFHTGQHLCWFYETEDEYRTGLTRFIEQGIEKNEKILFITDRSRGEGANDFEPELISLLSISPNSEQFIDSTSWNEFSPCQNPEAAIFQVKSLIAQALEEGYSGLWVTAELTRLARPGQPLDRWVKFESLLNELTREHPFLVLCQYPTRSFRPDQLQNLLEVHPEILLGDRVHENIYYLPPQIFSSPDRAQAGFQNHLRNIQAAAKHIERSDRAGVRFEEPVSDHRRKHDPSRLQYQALPLAAPASIWEEDLAELRASEARLVEARRLLQIDVAEKERITLALKQSEEKYRRLAEQMVDGVILTDETGRVAEWNRGAEQIFGIRKRDVLGKFLWDVQSQVTVHVGQRQLIVDRQRIIIQSALENGHSLQDDHPYFERIRRPDGVHRIVQSVTYTIESEKGNIVGGIFRDVTEEEEAKEALLESRERYRILSELTSDCAYCLGVRSDGTPYLEWVTDPEIMGWKTEELRQGKGFMEIVYPTDLAEYREHTACWLSGRESVREFRVVSKTGEVCWIRDSRRPVWSQEAERVIRVYGAITDITEQKQAEESLQKANQVLQAIITASPLAVIGVDLSRKITLWTPSAEKLFGWKAQEILGKRLSPSDHQLKGIVDEIFADTIQGKSLSNYEICPPTNDGTSLNVSVSTSPVIGPDDEVNGVMAIVMDIEQRKIAEAGLEKSLTQLHALSARLQSIREEERTRISREIHDELGQELTSLKMDLFWIKNRLEKNSGPASAGLASPQPLIEKMTDMLALIGTIISAVQRIATELRPSILDTLGLIPAMEWLAKDFNNRAGIDCKFQCNLDDLSLNPEVSTAIFRICQEALTNVARHAKASSVFILMQRLGDHLELEVTDNGTGIDLNRTDDVNSLGLLGMKERAFIIGGDVRFEVVSTGGTRVITTIPLTGVS